MEQITRRSGKALIGVRPPSTGIRPPLDTYQCSDSAVGWTCLPKINKPSLSRRKAMLTDLSSTSVDNQQVRTAKKLRRCPAQPPSRVAQPPDTVHLPPISVPHRVKTSSNVKRSQNLNISFNGNNTSSNVKRSTNLHIPYNVNTSSNVQTSSKLKESHHSMSPPNIIKCQPVIKCPSVPVKVPANNTKIDCKKVKTRRTSNQSISKKKTLTVVPEQSCEVSSDSLPSIKPVCQKSRTVEQLQEEYTQIIRCANEKTRLAAEQDHSFETIDYSQIASKIDSGLTLSQKQRSLAREELILRQSVNRNCKQLTVKVKVAQPVIDIEDAPCVQAIRIPTTHFTYINPRIPLEHNPEMMHLEKVYVWLKGQDTFFSKKDYSVTTSDFLELFERDD